MIRSTSVSPKSSIKSVVSLSSRIASAPGIVSSGLFHAYKKPPFQLRRGNGIEPVNYYDPDMSELSPELRNSEPKIFEFAQLKTKLPLYNNSDEIRPRCEGVSCFHNEYMLSNGNQNIQKIAAEYHEILELKPNWLMEFKTAILACCGARTYKYDIEELASMEPKHVWAHKKIYEYQKNYHLLENHCKRLGPLACYNTNFSETIHKILYIMEDKKLDHLGVKVHVPRHVLNICFFKCKPEEGDGYWIIPNEPNEAPYLPLKVSLDDVMNHRLQFNNIFRSRIDPNPQNLPLLISLDCMVLQDTVVSDSWYKSPLGEMLADNGKNRNEVEEYTRNIFLRGVTGHNVELIKFGVNILDSMPKYAEELDIHNHKEGQARINKENWATYYLIEAIEMNEPEIIKVLIEDLKVNVNSQCVAAIGAINSRGASLTTPLITAIQKGNIEMVKLLLSYGASIIYPKHDPAYKYAIKNKNIQDLLLANEPSIIRDEKGELILAPKNLG